MPKTPTYYGIFKFCDSGILKDKFLKAVKDAFIDKKTAPEENMYFKAVGEVTQDRLVLARKICDIRLHQRREDRLSRSHEVRVKWFIHKCDENGILIPTAKELKDAEKL